MDLHVEAEAIERLLHDSFGLVDALEATCVNLLLLLRWRLSVVDYDFDRVLKHHLD